MKVQKMNHVGVVVKDIDKAVSFYKDVFGASSTAITKREDLGVSVALVFVGDSELEMFAPLEQKPAGSLGETMQEFLNTRGEGMHHLAFSVDDIEGAVGEMRDRGLVLLGKAPRDGMHGKIAFVSEDSAYGTRIELCEPWPDGQIRLG
jgi:methylmalonyl-CoA/ethylmalonyl-CoA epimerase